ncbi:type IV conjugative transfer system protein TraL [Rhodanobacter sp. B2A1Ga4]|jgi:type IV conjugative transfer system protein TraL|uniref:type IV conjugative transfer system protein TraL n=1 Tax=Rhodanobacter sp. B2A1Ga4 TaxID=2778647 RepID=UPI001B3848FB|nr:type IV conjugative transfer system protein TraL [Rhodanobacter sp. B2A1Ga4]MBQ4855725.1 type IV conjugative transfer system protein TraL [Rhodanobacter sp. B2A1Ga4]
MERVAFPKDVDAPQRFLLWTMDQFIPFAALLGIGIFFHALFTSIVLGIALSWAFSRFKDSKPDGYLMHLAHWYGVVSPSKLRIGINPFIRRIFPT